MSDQIDRRQVQFLDVLEKHKGIIFKIANSYCHNPADREDLAQEITFQLWRSFEKYDDRFKWSTWIYRISLNTAISFYRDHHKEHEKIPISSVFQLSIPEDEENENLRWLQTFIWELSKMERALILLYLDELKYQEIAEVTGLTATNVSTRIFRIRKKLQEKFEKINRK